MAKLIESLNNLEELDLIGVSKSEPDLEYAFKHVFTQESVYRSLLRSDRRNLHRQIGEALEKALSNAHEDNDVDLLLAYHFEQGQDKERALKYLQRAGDYARTTYDNQEAKDLYTRALAMLEYSDYTNRWEILSKLEIILNRLGKRDQQANTLTQMQTLAELTVDKERLAATHNRVHALNKDPVADDVGLVLYQEARSSRVCLGAADALDRCHTRFELLGQIAVVVKRVDTKPYPASQAVTYDDQTIALVLPLLDCSL